MKVLVACEESQEVCKELRKRGHRAFSCDIQDCSGGHPEWHIKDDVTALVNGNCSFKLQNGTTEEQTGKWDMIIAFPPCTHLAVSGAAWFDKKREDGRQEAAIKFFMDVMNADCEKISVENPVNIISGDYIEKHFPELQKKYQFPIKPTQSIQPFQFGDRARKKTCLWLKGLPELKPTNIVEIPPRKKFDSGKSMPSWYAEAWHLPKEERAKLRSKTFPGIARAMAEQWG